MKVPPRNRCLLAALVSSVTVAFLLGPALRGEEPNAAPEPPRGEQAPVGTIGAALTPARVQEKIKELETTAGVEEELKKKLLELYQQAQSHLQKAAEHSATAETFRQSIENAPKRTKELRGKLEQAASEPKPAAADEVPPGATAKDLEVKLVKEQADLAAAKSALEKLERQLRDQQARADKAREEQARAKQTLAEIEKGLKAEPAAGENPLLTEASRTVLEARKSMRTEEVSVLEQEVLSLPGRIELFTAERDLAAREVSRLQARLKSLEELLNQRQGVEAEIARREAERARREAAGKHPAIASLADRNKALSEELARIVTAAKAATPDRQLKENQKQQLEEVYTRTKAQLEQAGPGGVQGDILHEQRKALPELLRDNQRVLARWRGKISEAEARRFQIGTDLRSLSDVDQAVAAALEKELATPVPEEQRQEIEAEVRKLLTDRQELLKKLDDNYESHLKTLRTLDSAQRELAATARKFANLLAEQLLWIPSAAPPGGKTLSDLKSSLAWLVAPEQWAQAGQVLAADVRDRPELAALVVLAFAGLFMGRRRLNRELHAIARKVGSVDTDSVLLTLAALACTALVVAPWPLLVTAAGWRLGDGGNGGAAPFAAAAGAGLTAVAALLAAIRFFQVLCRPRGVAEVHFRWRSSSLQLVRWHLGWVLGILPVTAFLVGLTEAQGAGGIRDSLGRLAFMVAAVAQAVFIHRVVRPTGGITEHAIRRRPEGWLARLRYVWYPLAVAVPLGLLVAAASGYYYTALELERRLIASIWLVAGVVIGQHLALRWLVIEQRRLAVEKAREERKQREAAAAQAEEAAQATGQPQEKPPAGLEELQPVLDVPEVELSAINEQTRELLRALIGTAVVLGLWLIWSGVLPALAILEQVRLWPTQVLDDSGATVTRWITLEHVALAVIALILTVVAAKNLPGLLEIAVLKNLPFEPGMRYALTTVSQYILGAVGIVAAFNVIGVGWSKVQWLVAALSVGIGFGLQEIIANFVCGLILLFERPIRIGDIVTIGDTMGVVSKIRIRATTITNWDRMEFVVPNKDLITGRLLNWTLSNTVNRIVVNVGISYDDDPDRARAILLKVAADHPLIMKDPAPLASFEGFGDSSLNLALRCYLPDFANRLAVIHELHVGVKRAFDAAGITIPFPQRDLHLSSAAAPLRVAAETRVVQEVASPAGGES